MSIPRDHHFLPVFYLDQWAGNDGDLIEYSIKYRKLIAKPVGPAGTGFERDLYSFPELPPEEAQHLESKFFDYADRVASDALKRHLVRSNEPWTDELRSGWSRFVLGIHLRHPDAIAEIRSAAKASWDRSGGPAQVSYERIRNPDDPATFEEYIETKHPLTPVRTRVNAIMKIIDNEKVCSHINGMHWDVVDLSRASIPLLTSDRPVEISKLKERTGIVSIPISPANLFVAANRVDTLRNIVRAAPRKLAKSVNKYVVSRARRFVYAPNERQTPFIEKHMSKAMEPLPLFPNTAKINTPDYMPRNL